MGCVTPVGEQGSCIAKTAALAAFAVGALALSVLAASRRDTR